MVMRHITLTFMSFYLFNNLNANSAELINNQQEIITKDDDVHKYLHFLWCPPKHLGTMCPENSLTHYYYCCGDLKNRCCYTTRTWVICACLAVPVAVCVNYYRSHRGASFLR
ncbi:hypothetical protein ACH3XW_13435 [Acanthocheilonema viteae]